MNPTSDNQEAVEKVQELIKDIDIAMLTTISEKGLVSRPMKTQDVEFDSNLWFLTKKILASFMNCFTTNKSTSRLWVNLSSPSVVTRNS